MDVNEEDFIRFHISAYIYVLCYLSFVSGLGALNDCWLTLVYLALQDQDRWPIGK